MATCTSQRNEPIPLGFIGSIDQLTIHALPAVDKVLATEISIVQEVGDITLIAVRVCSAGQLIAERTYEDIFKERMRRKKTVQPAALTDRTSLRVRFSEVDSMQIVWHGEYVRYFEDGREAFGPTLRT